MPNKATCVPCISSIIIIYSRALYMKKGFNKTKNKYHKHQLNGWQTSTEGERTPPARAHSLQGEEKEGKGSCLYGSIVAERLL